VFPVLIGGTEVGGRRLPRRLFEELHCWGQRRPAPPFDQRTIPEQRWHTAGLRLQHVVRPDPRREQRLGASRIDRMSVINNPFWA